MHDIEFFADIRYSDILQLILPIIYTNNNLYLHFFPHLIAEIVKSLLWWIYMQCYYADSYSVGPPANAGIKYKA